MNEGTQIEKHCYQVPIWAKFWHAAIEIARFWPPFTKFWYQLELQDWSSWPKYNLYLCILAATLMNFTTVIILICSDKNAYYQQIGGCMNTLRLLRFIQKVNKSVWCVVSTVSIGQQRVHTWAGSEKGVTVQSSTIVSKQLLFLSSAAVACELHNIAALVLSTQSASHRALWCTLGSRKSWKSNYDLLSVIKQYVSEFSFFFLDSPKFL